MIDASSKFKEYCVPEGRHKSRPFRLFRFGFGNYSPDKEITIVQGTDSVYLIRGDDGKVHPDQWDWLKVVGRKFRLSPHKETYMLATRFNHISGMFEYTTYFHHDGDVILGDGTRIREYVYHDVVGNTSVSPTLSKEIWQEAMSSSQALAHRAPGEALVVDEVADHDVRRYGFEIYDDDGKSTTYSVEHINRNFFWMRTHPWFGGNRKSPIDWRVYIKNW